MRSIRAATGSLAAMAVALAAFAVPAAALGGSTSVRFNVTVTVLPSKRQSTLDSAITLRAPDGTAVTLTPQQKLLWLENPQALVRAVAPNANGLVVVTVEM